MTLAQEAGDAEFAAYVFGRMAQRAANAVDCDRVLGLARAAGRSGSGGAQVQAFAAVQRAHGHAIAGDTCAFQAAVDDAQQLVAADGLAPGEPAAHVDDLAVPGERSHQCVEVLVVDSLDDAAMGPRSWSPATPATGPEAAGVTGGGHDDAADLPGTAGPEQVEPVGAANTAGSPPLRLV
ncbi:hypothetical protein ACGF7U_30265 [Micromonospora sp. NPDC047670]|uniref:hypothetical protein n=1 Tax=Micromonospora sp. NPDC047670 TaxID=3364252 RepID=UPI0037140B10